MGCVPAQFRSLMSELMLAGAQLAGSSSERVARPPGSPEERPLTQDIRMRGWMLGCALAFGQSLRVVARPHGPRS